MKAKSRVVRELISFIHSSPYLFRANNIEGFQSERFNISLAGNTRMLSIINLEIDGKISL